MSFEEIILYLTTKQAIVVYLILAFSAFIENIFPPYPSDLIILAGAFMAGTGEINYIPLFIVTTIGGLAGAMVLYFFGYTKGRLFFQKYNRSYFKLEYLAKIEIWFQRWGNMILILSRIVAGVRSLIAIAAGIAKVPAPRMTFFTLISFCLWYGILIGGMYLVKSNWLELVRLIKSYEMLVIIFSAIIVTIWLIIIYRKNRVRG